MSDEAGAKYLQVITTFGLREDAERVAADALNAHLAACVQIEGPFTSRYRWKGALESSEEWRCVFKTTAAAYPRLEHLIQTLHPYETPEIVAVELSGGSAAYLQWIDSVVDVE